MKMKSLEDIYLKVLLRSMFKSLRLKGKEKRRLRGSSFDVQYVRAPAEMRVKVYVPVVSLPKELYVDQIRGFGDALSVRLHEVCVWRQLLLPNTKKIEFFSSPIRKTKENDAE